MQAELSLRGVELHEKDEEMDEIDIGVLIRKSPKWFQSKKKKKKMSIPLNSSYSSESKYKTLS